MAQLEIDGVVTRDVALLRDCDRLALWLPQLIRRIGMRPVGPPIIQPYAHWNGSAPSAVQFMEESAVVVHTYPQANYIEITLHSCNVISDHESIITEVVGLLGLRLKRVHYAPERNWRNLSQAPDIPWPSIR